MNNPATSPGCLLGFDVGSRRIGVAVGNTLSASARGIDVVAMRDEGPDWEHVDKLIRQWRPNQLLVGDPLTLNGDVQEITRIARRFAEQLGERSGLPVALVDERSSSREADRRFASRRADGRARRKDAAQLDAVAAEIIIERWFDHDLPAFSFD
ncbi:MAG: Holliday junction resolvase RuvX [Rhodanobacteraceae bacterium]|nr:Holliday junction resolvase RuvX [Xanthomonadales bacterium]MCP5479382.1 Holliday junction resolvase RuvX [Rhodanobacteraceae bacterium]HPF72643.1 Holliday junction resolvase RuvX [Xanthomonadaceae bacterium]HRY00070.1 Holliday junction resolvase RuvX [Xanthomonadaceae bacterium]